MNAEFDVGDEVIVDEPITAEELNQLRTHRHDPTYTPKGNTNPLHENWTDTEVLLLSPLWDRSDPLTCAEIEAIALTHPVLVARPGQEFYRNMFYAYARYCIREFETHHDDRWLQACTAIMNAFHFDDVVRYATSVQQRVSRSMDEEK